MITEIGLLKKLKHRFIVDLVDFHWDDKYIYIGKTKHYFLVQFIANLLIYLVMEYCGGGDLSSVIKQRKCLPEISIKRFLQQLASALQFLRLVTNLLQPIKMLFAFVLRQNNVSHMDLKPSNLLIKGSNPPILKVADFGFAQYLEENNKDKGLKGKIIFHQLQQIVNVSCVARLTSVHGPRDISI